MRLTLFFSLFLFISGCTSQKYLLTTDRSMIKSYQTKEFKSGEIFEPPKTDYYQNKTIYIPEVIAKEPIINYIVNSIKKGEYDDIKNNLKTEYYGNPYLPFAYGLVKLFQGSYSDAIHFFKNNRQNNIQYIVELLIVDCEFEISLINSYDINYNIFLEKYQKILDNYSLDENYKEIINSRIKFVRYKF